VSVLLDNRRKSAKIGKKDSFWPFFSKTNHRERLEGDGARNGFFLEEWLKINNFVRFFNFPLSLNDFNDEI